MSVFVTDGDQRSTLAVVRSLGRAGIAVTVGHSSERSLAGSSRHCARRFAYPSPVERPAEFQAAIEGEMNRQKYRMLLPMTDVTTLLLAERGEDLRRRVVLPVPSLDVLQKAQDKRGMLLRARELGIAVPQTYMLERAEKIEEVAGRVAYPAVIKPRISKYLCRGRWVAGDVQFAANREELLARYSASHARIPYPMVQEKIKGDGRGVFLMLWNGELLSAFCHQRLREKPPWGGVSVLRESLPLDDELVEKSAALLRAIGWQGVAMVEFKTDERDGQAHLMEVNGRFWGSLQLAIDAGVDFPYLFYRAAIGESVEPQMDYEAGVKTRWLLGDLDNLLIQLSHRNDGSGNGTGASRFRAMLDFMKFYQRGMHYEIESVDDPGPGWFESKAWLAEAFGRHPHGGMSHAG